MATIDLTLDSFKVPAIESYTPPFGTKIVKTDANKGGLSTVEVNSNIMMPFANMRAKVVTENSTTSDVEYDAKLVFSSLLQSGVTLSLGSATYEGCEVQIQNFADVNCTLTTATWSTSIAGNNSAKLVWTGADWTINDGANIGDVKPCALTTVSVGWMECNGQAISRTIYSRLFKKFSSELYDSDPSHTLLSRYGTGDESTTFNLPDFRESTLVGVGSNSTHITDLTTQAHEEHTLGEWKDDQFQGHEHQETGRESGRESGSDKTQVMTNPSGVYTMQIVSDGTHGTPRIGFTTHGKQIGVKYLIKVL